MAACQKMLPGKEDAEELVMNVFLKIWQHKDQLSHVLKFDDYLFGILPQQIVRHARKGVVITVQIDDQILNEMGSIDHPEFDLQDLKVRYQAALTKLHPRHYGYDKKRQQPIYSGTVDSRFSNTYLLSNTPAIPVSFRSCFIHWLNTVSKTPYVE